MRIGPMSTISSAFQRYISAEEESTGALRQCVVCLTALFLELSWAEEAFSSFSVVAPAAGSHLTLCRRSAPTLTVTTLRQACRETARSASRS